VTETLAAERKLLAAEADDICVERELVSVDAAEVDATWIETSRITPPDDCKRRPAARRRPMARTSRSTLSIVTPASVAKTCLIKVLRLLVNSLTLPATSSSTPTVGTSTTTLPLGTGDTGDGGGDGGGGGGDGGGGAIRGVGGESNGGGGGAKGVPSGGRAGLNGGGTDGGGGGVGGGGGGEEGEIGGGRKPQYTFLCAAWQPVSELDWSFRLRRLRMLGGEPDMPTLDRLTRAPAAQNPARAASSPGLPWLLRL
jgi:hypothetical protein